MSDEPKYLVLECTADGLYVHEMNREQLEERLKEEWGDYVISTENPNWRAVSENTLYIFKGEGPVIPVIRETVTEWSVP